MGLFAAWEFSVLLFENTGSGMFEPPGSLCYIVCGLVAFINKAQRHIHHLDELGTGLWHSGIWKIKTCSGTATLVWCRFSSETHFTFEWFMKNLWLQNWIETSEINPPSNCHRLLGLVPKWRTKQSRENLKALVWTSATPRFLPFTCRRKELHCLQCLLFNSAYFILTIIDHGTWF